MRGLVILLMFLVNSAGNDPAFPSWFPHRGWNDGAMGLGLADIVFPWFLFVVGVSVPLSMRSGRGARRSTLARLTLAFKRALTIDLLGTLLWCATIAFNPQTPITWRVILHWDILPLIALGYLLAVSLELLTRWSHLAFVAIVLSLKWTSLTLVPHPDTNSVLWEHSRSFDHVVKAPLGWLGVLLTQGLPAAATLAALWWVIDLRQFTRATPLRVVGMNAIALYLLAELLWKTVLIR